MINATYIKNLGTLAPFEIKNNSFVLLLGAPSTCMYFAIMHYYHPEMVLPFYGNVFFSAAFLIAGLLPYTKKDWLTNYYGLITFFITISFQHYLIYATYINNFSLDWLLVTYVFIFGSILLLNKRTLVVTYVVTLTLHLCYHVLYSSLSDMNKSAIFLSLFVLFLFSFRLISSFRRYQRKMRLLNADLENTVQQRRQDLTERAQQLLRKNKDLEEFAYVVSHDLKRPLRNMHTLTSWLTEENAQLQTGDASKNMELIQEQIVQMELIIEGILNYSLQADKIQKKQQIDTIALVQHSIQKYKTSQVDFEIKTSLPSVSFNQTQLQQIFHSLIENAIKHAKTAHINISVGHHELSDAYEFYVKDNGIGIAEKYHEKIFQLFQKLETDVSVTSIGIGLSLVKKIIERNGGSIRVESSEGKGATFYFTISK